MHKGTKYNVMCETDEGPWVIGDVRTISLLLPDGEKLEIDIEVLRNYLEIKKEG